MKNLERLKDRTVVGTYGCKRLDRVVRIRPPRGHLRKKPSFWTTYNVLCPCGERHHLRPTWRWAARKERDDAEVTLRLEDVVT